MMKISFIFILLSALSAGALTPPVEPPPNPPAKEEFKNPLYPNPNGTAPNPNANATTPAPAVSTGASARAGLGYKSEILDGFYEEFVYEPSDKRDPFSIYVPKSFISGPITSPLQRFTLEELKLVGIVWNVKRPKAMVLDPGGATHIIMENDKIGKSDGYVAKIREGELVVIEVHADLEGNKAYLTKTMLLRKK